MKDHQSGLETWRYLVQSDPGRDAIESYLPIVLSAAGAIGIAPFAVMRLLNGEWLIGVVDTVIVAGFVTLGAIVYRTRRIRFVSVALSLLCVGGVIASVYVSGPDQVFWSYPALMAVFYLSKLREAALFAIVLLIALLPVVTAAHTPFETATILISIVVMSLFAFAFSVITDRQRRLLIQMATKDPLTGAGNRRALEAKLDEVIASHGRSKIPSSLILLDLDHFKLVNDAHGHAVGDQILRNVTDLINMRIRRTDGLYRIGGEEFIIVVEGQDAKHAEHLAEQLRTIVKANELVPDQDVTLSLGVAELHRGETAHDWMHRADEALYTAKRDGRDTTSVAA